MDIQEALQRTLKTVQAPSLNNTDPVDYTSPARFVQEKNSYMDYTLLAEHIAYTGGFAEVDLHLVNRKDRQNQVAYAKNNLVAFN